MNILLIGAGGREHALAWKIRQSPLVKDLYCAPGNAGISEEATCIDLDATDHHSVIHFCHEHAIALVVIGPEIPLVAGIADDLNEAGIAVFGPSKQAAQLEGSKGFTKDICAEFDIPTAAYGRFSNSDDAVKYVQKHGAPIVVKADGLAAGKGVIIAMTEQEAIDAIHLIFDGGFGSAGAEVVIEEFLTGEEASFFALADGKTTLALTTAQDHKAVGEGDTGPNTGGMGAYSPAPVMTASLIDQVMHEIINPTVGAMAKKSMPFKGVLFAGLMITQDGPKLIEYNCRFGDPECQVLMTRMESDIVPLLLATANEKLSSQTVEWKKEAALTVVLAAKGYPGSYDKGSTIKHIEEANTLTGVKVFHAGTSEKNDEIIAIGGRVLNVTAMASNVTEAQQLAYVSVDKIDWPEGFCRRDIGWRAVEREAKT